ncbi:DUF1294 domain-containing protein [Brevibacillus sp. GCM10020057]|uniref:DUF1294 domain-containing protein n=1 Tax=Brevibacillus sp. GCM10020057 TaxID=3317327 RepID=UPI003644501C
MYHNQLQAHRRNRNLLLAAGWALVLAGAGTPMPWLIAAGGLLLNGYAYFLMRTDKRLAPRQGYRIPEASLLLAAALGGGIGALVGMLAFRHKTRHVSFLVLVPVFCLLQLFLLILTMGK